MRLAGKVVGGGSEPAIGALAQRRLGRMVLDELVGNLVRGADGGRARIVVVMLPGNQRSIASRAGLDLNQAGGAEIGPGKLLAARPHHLHRLAGGLGQARGFNCRLAGMLAAIAAAHVGLDDAHLGRRKMKRLHEFVANAEWALRSCPHGQLVVVPLGHGGARLKRRMRNVLHGVLLFQLQVGACHGLCHGTGYMLRAFIAGRLSGLFFRYSKRPSIRWLRGHIPFCLDCGQCLLRGECVWARPPDEIAVAHDFDAGKFFRGAGVD